MGEHHAKVTRRDLLLGLSAAAVVGPDQARPTLIQQPSAPRRLPLSDLVAVGPARDVKTIAHAARIIKPHGVIEVDEGVYREAVAFTVPVTLRAAAHQKVRVDAAGLRLPDDKAVFLFAQPATIQGFEISGAAGVNSSNGAAIRNAPAVDLTVLNCDLHHCQEGILATGGDLTIRDSRIHHNSTGDQEHNVYYAKFKDVPLGTLLIENSAIFHAAWGNNVKSNARRTIVRNTDVGTTAVPKGTSFDHWYSPPPTDAKLEWLQNHPNCEAHGWTANGKEFDISAGGDLLIENCRIFKGGSGSGYFIGYGFESHDSGSGPVIVRDCTFYKEREPCYLGNRVPNVTMTIERCSFGGTYDAPIVLDTKQPNGVEVPGAKILLRDCHGH
jgi:hypothetical protein